MYKIVRYFQSGNSVTVEDGLSLKEVKEHCRDPESSSSTCEDDDNQEITRLNGPWFDGYTEE